MPEGRGHKPKVARGKTGYQLKQEQQVKRGTSDIVEHVVNGQSKSKN